MADVKRNHHFVPKHYLKGFADYNDSAFIWVYRPEPRYDPGSVMGKSNPCRLSLKRAGASRDFYATEGILDPLPPDFWENVLEKREQPAQRVLRKLRLGRNISDEEKAILSEYMSLMINRVPNHREPLEEILDRRLSPEAWDKFNLRIILCW